MLTLYICRHAKSSWADPGQADFDRPLNERGSRDAPLMARAFQDRKEPVDLIVSSTARRALSTAQHYADILQASEVKSFDPTAERPQLILERTLYHPSILTILGLVNNFPDTVQAAMIFGHNPGFTEAVEYFSSGHIGNMPTSGIARIDFPVGTWRAVSRDLGTLVWMDTPKAHSGEPEGSADQRSDSR